MDFLPKEETGCELRKIIKEDNIVSILCTFRIWGKENVKNEIYIFLRYYDFEFLIQHHPSSSFVPSASYPLCSFICYRLDLRCK